MSIPFHAILAGWKREFVSKSKTWKINVITFTSPSLKVRIAMLKFAGH
jgi:hypothetical protein